MGRGHQEGVYEIGMSSTGSGCKIKKTLARIWVKRLAHNTTFSDRSPLTPPTPAPGNLLVRSHILFTHSLHANSPTHSAILAVRPILLPSSTWTCFNKTFSGLGRGDTYKQIVRHRSLVRSIREFHQAWTSPAVRFDMPKRPRPPRSHMQVPPSPQAIIDRPTSGLRV